MKINIKNLSLLASVGCFSYEYDMKTKIIISCVVEYKPENDFSNPQNIINYDDLLNSITQTVNAKHFPYIEQMAFEISDEIKKVSHLIAGGSVTVQKCIKGNIVQELSCQVSF
jgi:FolB domain-containing protein